MVKPGKISITYWLFIIVSIALILLMATMWSITTTTRNKTQAEYEFFQNDLFQHTAFSNKSIFSIQRIVDYAPASDNLQREIESLSTFSRAIVGHQAINSAIIQRTIEHLPGDDPLLLKQRLVDMDIRIKEAIRFMDEFDQRVQDASSIAALTATTRQYRPQLKHLVNTLNDNLNLQSQIQSVFFSDLKKNLSQTMARLKAFFYILIVLFVLAVFLISLHLIDQKRIRKALTVTHAALEQRVKERTQALADANKKLKTEMEERQRVRMALARYGTILEKSLNEIYVIDAQSLKFIQANEGARRNLGYEMEALWEMTPVDIIPDLTADDFEKRVAPLRAGSQDTVVFQSQHRRKDGSRYAVEVHLQLMEFEQRPVFVASIADITDKLKMEEQLRQAHKMESIGTLAGGIAHEFNNILSIVMGNTELALDDLTARTPAHKNLEEIKTATLRARDVVRQLLNFSRLSEQNRKPVTLAPIISEAIKLIRASVPSTIRIQADLQARDSIVRADPTQIHQVLINLITNASHAMEENGGSLDIALEEINTTTPLELKFKTLAPGRYLRLSVRDSGVGIEPEILDRVFDPYFTTKDVDKGTGMGLAVVHGIVKGHDGAMEIKSQPALGTVVWVFLPVVDTAPEIEPTAVKPVQGGEERILFVDDETAIAKTGTDILQRLGYRVDAFSDPVEALSAFSARPFDYHLAITDMTMPNMRGDILARRILSIRSDIPVIISSGFSEKIDSNIAKTLGVRRYIQKPLDKADLASAIRDALDS